MKLAQVGIISIFSGSLLLGATTTSSTTSTRLQSVSRDSIGVHLGPAMATVSLSPVQGQQVSKTNSRTRMFFGVNYTHQFLTALSGRAELNYSQRGFSSGGENAQDPIYDTSVDYIELPIAVQGQVQAGAFTPYALTGPFLGLMIGKGQTVSLGTETQENSLENRINSMAFGWNFGLGSKLDLGQSVALDLGLRYSLGISNVVNRPQEVGLSSGKLNAFQILAGLSFAI